MYKSSKLPFQYVLVLPPVHVHVTHLYLHCMLGVSETPPQNRNLTLS